MPAKWWSRLLDNYPLLLLTVIASLNYFDRNIFSIVLQSIKAEMRISDTALGLVAGLAFVLFYSILGVPIAHLADRYSRRNIITIGLTFWSLMTALTGMVVNVWQLALTRFLMGAGEASAVAPSNSMASDLYRKEHRPLAVAIIASGSSLGYLFGYPLGGYIDQHYGWRAAFWVAGIPGMLIALLFFATVKEPERGSSEEGRPSIAVSTFLETALFLARSRSYCFVVLGGSMMAIYMYASLTWSPAFLARVHHFTSSEVGTYVGVARGIMGLAGTLLGGLLTERLGRRDERWRAWLPALACALTAPANLLFLYPHSRWLVVSGLGAGSFFAAMHLGPLYALCMHVARVRMRATATATFLLFANMIGQILGPFGVGYLNDALTSTYGATAIRYSLLVGTAFALFAGIFLAICGRYTVEDARRATAA
jgi:MFS family permease